MKRLLQKQTKKRRRNKTGIPQVWLKEISTLEVSYFHMTETKTAAKVLPQSGLTRL